MIKTNCLPSATETTKLLICLQFWRQLFRTFCTALKNQNKLNTSFDDKYVFKNVFKN